MGNRTKTEKGVWGHCMNSTYPKITHRKSGLQLPFVVNDGKSTYVAIDNGLKS